MGRTDYNGKANICGEKIAIMRVRQKLSQRQLAEKMQERGLTSFDAKAVSRLEGGIRTVADYELLYLSQILGAPIDWLLQDDISWE